MTADYQLWEIPYLLRYSTQLSISISVIPRLLYYKNKTQVNKTLFKGELAVPQILYRSELFPL
ncbi:hypothetical protein T10_11347 [Trichinella papuae]|uniref:Uncharacterized protein n=1 Tax=Trichinella papuae TaxID=268474 RepID=A0A0V1MTL2_9BILA|nr:hypothetical protein T10_11347 [Trichinella papuae]